MTLYAQEKLRTGEGDCKDLSCQKNMCASSSARWIMRLVNGTNML